MTSSLKDLANVLGVSQNAADIFLTLFLHGALSTKDLSLFLERNESDIEKNIEELIQKSFIDYDRTLHIYSAKQIDDLEKIHSKTVADFIKKSISSVFLKQNQQSVMMYEGYDGIRKVYLEVLEEAIQTKQPIYAIENIPDKNTSPIGSSFLENYYQKRIRNKVTVYVICSNTLAAREYKKNCENEFTKVKILSELTNQGTINIAGNLAMSYSLSPPRGTLRYDGVEAHDLKNIFQILWKF